MFGAYGLKGGRGSVKFDYVIMEISTVGVMKAERPNQEFVF